MLKEFVEKLLELARPETVNIQGRQYATNGLKPVYDPTPESLTVHTLTSIQDYIQAGMDVQEDGPIMIHILSEKKVSLISVLDKPWEQRHVYMTAELIETKFAFGQAMNIEEFIIGLQSKFQETEDRETLLKLVSSLKAGQEITLGDDGISQKTTVMRGVSLAKEITVPKRVKLRPWRTFPEIENQPESEFVFRIRDNGDNLPLAALFEADGGKWRNYAIDSIRKWFEAELPNMMILG